MPDGCGGTVTCAATAPCPVDCVVSEWGGCSVECGGGIQTRTVVTPASNGGADCPPLEQVCNTDPCDPEVDLCPDDPGKIDPGACGCGLPDTDSDGDGAPDCVDACPDDPNDECLEGEDAVCGNGAMEEGETCDDGNTQNGDCCSSSCQMESDVCSNIASCQPTVPPGMVRNDDGTCGPESHPNQDKVVICHVPPGNPAAAHTIIISSSAWKGDCTGLPEHACHCAGCHGGDYLGTCVIPGPVCGDGVAEGDEECDGSVPPGAPEGSVCTELCTVYTPACGNSVQDANEECDDGNIDPNDGCSPTCTVEVCGDSIQQLNEECDGSLPPGGVFPEGAYCQDDCRIYYPACGNQILDPGEECDGSLPEGSFPAGTYCQGDCSIYYPVCGNLILDPGEQCDDGGTANGDGCNQYCQTEYCGDGTLQPGEECDDSNSTDGDGCNSDCVVEFCGDEILQSGLGETCDDGNTTDGDGCNAQCQPEACGDGKLDVNEGCDDGNTDPNDGCSPVCQPEVCGDDIKQANEACDGNDFGGSKPLGAVCTERCTVLTPNLSIGSCIWGPEGPWDIWFVGRDVAADWQVARYGGGQTFSFSISPGQTIYESTTLAGTWVKKLCVDGTCVNKGGTHVTALDQWPSQACPGAPICGDEIVTSPEECDDGNLVDGDGCNAQCLNEFCGDGVWQEGLQEECDGEDLPEGSPEGAACNAQCVLEYCGDGVVNGEEDCDGEEWCTETCEIKELLDLVLDPYCATKAGVGPILNWSFTNPNAFTVPISWTLDGAPHGPVMVGAGMNYFAGDTLDAPPTHTLTAWIDLPGGPSETFVSDKNCETPPPPPPPPPAEVAPIPVTGAGGPTEPLIIPVTGVDLTLNLAGLQRLFTTMGFMLFGITMVLEGVDKRLKAK